MRIDLGSFILVALLLVVSASANGDPAATRPVSYGNTDGVSEAARRVTLLENPNGPQRRWTYEGSYTRNCKGEIASYSTTAFRYRLGEKRLALVLDDPVFSTNEYIVLIYRIDASEPGDDKGGQMPAKPSVQAEPPAGGEFQAEELWLWNGPGVGEDRNAALSRYLSLSSDERRRAPRSNELKGKAFIREKDGLPQRAWFEKLVTVSPLPDNLDVNAEAKLLESERRVLRDKEKRVAATNDSEDKESVEDQRDSVAVREAAIDGGTKAAAEAFRDIAQRRATDWEKVVAAGGGAHAKERLELFQLYAKAMEQRVAIWDDHATFSGCDIRGQWRDKGARPRHGSPL